MPTATQDLLFNFLGIDSGAGAQFDRMAGKAKMTGSSLTRFGAAAAVVAGIVAVASAKMAATFQQSTELIHTQAGATQAQVDGYRKSILSLAGATATAPEALSEALFHIASTGVQGAQAIRELTVAAEGAKVGGADLTDVTNALNATIVSGITGSKNYAAAMGALNTIVGTGDMHMQDLAEALGTGVLPIIKAFGVSLPQAGAALAVFGDNNIRGAQAATSLRMAVQALAHPVDTATASFAQLGLNGANALTHFATDMQKGGLEKALSDLHSRLVAAGDVGAKTGAILVDAFGKRAGTGLAVLIEEFGRYQTKLAEIKEGAGTFGSDWIATTKTVSFQFDRLRADVDALAIHIGDALIPATLDVIHGFVDFGRAAEAASGFIDRNKVAIGALAGIITTAFIPAAVEATTAFAASIWADVALRVLYVGDAVKSLGTAIKAMTAEEIASVSIATLGMAAIGAAVVEAFVQVRDKAKEGTEYATNFVNSLHVNENSLASIDSAKTKIAETIAAMKTPGTDPFGVLKSSIKAMTGQFNTLTAAGGRVAENTKLMSTEFGLTVPQVVDLANKLGKNALAGSTQQVETGFQRLVGAAQATKSPMKMAAAGFAAMVSPASTAAQAVAGLNQQFTALLAPFLGVKQAELDFKNDLVGLDQALKKSNNSMALNTAAGRAARGQYLTTAGALNSVAAAMAANGDSTDQIRAKLKAMVAQMGDTPAAGKLVTDTMKHIKAVMDSLKGDASTAGKMIGQNLDQGITTGMGALLSEVTGKAREVLNAAILAARKEAQATSPSKRTHQLGVDLAEGLINGWTGEASRIKDALSTGIQDALSHLQTVLNAALSKQETVLKAAQSKLTSDLAARKSAISSLQSSIAGNANISNIFGTDANGNPTTGNISSYLSAQIPQLRTEAKDLARLRKMGLSQALLAQISALPPSQAIAAMQQILSGQDGSISSLNAQERLIQQYAKASAVTTVESPGEKARIALDRENLKWQKLTYEGQKEMNRHLERIAARDVAGSFKWTINGKTFDPTNPHDVRQLIQEMRKLGFNASVSA